MSLAVLRIFPSTACAVTYDAFDVGGHVGPRKGSSDGVVLVALAGVFYERRIALLH